MPKIRYQRTFEGIQKWFKDNPRLCWADLVMWEVTGSTIEDIGECKGCDYCGRVTYGDYNTVFSQQLRKDSK